MLLNLYIRALWKKSARGKWSGTRDTIRHLKTFGVISNEMPVLLFILCWCYFSCLQMYIFSSAVSRAILKLVYRLGIPNSGAQTLKTVKINYSKDRQMTIHALVPQCAEPWERCFELFGMQNSQNLPELHPWTPPGEDLQCTSRLPSCTTVFILATLVKKPAPPKNCWIRHCLEKCFNVYFYE